MRDEPTRGSGGGTRCAVVAVAAVVGVLSLGQSPASAQELRLLKGDPLIVPAPLPEALVPELPPPPAGPGRAAIPAAIPTSTATTAAPLRLLTTSAGDRKPGSRPPSAVRVPSPAPEQATPAAAPPGAPAAPRTTAPAAAPAQAPGSAGAHCSGDGWQQRRGAAALASLRGGAARTGFRVAFKPARKGYMGLTYLKERRIEIFVRSCSAMSDALLRHVTAHELGHAYDTTHMTRAKRQAWQAARGIPLSTPWYGCSGCTDFATPAGDFAEVYAQWARGSSTNRSELAGDVPAAALAQLARQFFGA